jgi:hypothetical protein
MLKMVIEAVGEQFLVYPAVGEAGVVMIPDGCIKGDAAGAKGIPHPPQFAGRAGVRQVAHNQAKIRPRIMGSQAGRHPLEPCWAARALEVRVIYDGEDVLVAAPVAGKPRAARPCAQRQERSGAEAQPFAPGHARLPPRL